MKKLPDHIFAQWMLDTRDRGFSYGAFLRSSTKSYFILILLYGLMLSLLAYLDAWIAFALLAGMLLGCLLRDVSWVGRTRKAWPFTVKVTDWDTVQKIAGESRSN